MQQLVGQPLAVAQRAAQQRNYHIRIIQQDDREFCCLVDHRERRINVRVRRSPSIDTPNCIQSLAGVF